MKGWKDGTARRKDLALALAKGVLHKFDPQARFGKPITTQVSLVLPADTDERGKICVKVRLKAIDEVIEGSRVRPVPYEVQAFQIIANAHPWAAHLLDHSKDTMWLMRQWVGDETIDRTDPSYWSRPRLDALLDLFAGAFRTFHDREEPWLLRDLKPQNVARSGDTLQLFDFGTARPLSWLIGSKRRSRLGDPSRSTRYKPPELLRETAEGADKRADYFAFGTLFHMLATGTRKPIWSNTETDAAASARRYLSEYDKALPAFADRLGALGYDAQVMEGLTGLLHPDMQSRPDRFPWPAPTTAR